MVSSPVKAKVPFPHQHSGNRLPWKGLPLGKERAYRWLFTERCHSNTGCETDMREGFSQACCGPPVTRQFERTTVHLNEIHRKQGPGSVLSALFTWLTQEVILTEYKLSMATQTPPMRGLSLP